MSRQLDTLRNIGIMAHIDAGKTTVTERMLFYCGAKHKMGEVDKGTTETDFDPEEQQRGITIYSACVTFNWNDIKINLIDTPGHVDFTAEVERSLRVLDGGIVVLSAREGVEAQSETVWRQADKYRVSRLVLINKMDREGADFEKTLEEIGRRLDARPVAIQLPVGAGPEHAPDPFRGVVDLIDMKMLVFDRESQGVQVVQKPLPQELLHKAEIWHTSMLESLYDYSDELTELAIAEQPVSESLIREIIRKATVAGKIQPVLCGSALNYIGIQPLLDAVANYLPSPKDMPPVDGDSPGKKAVPALRNPRAGDPFCALVFKIVADKHGDLSYLRVYSGELAAGSRVLNAGREKKENIPQLWHLQADRRRQVKVVSAGDIVGVVGLRHTVTGDTLCDPKHPIVLEKIVFPETVLSMAIEPENSSERKKLSETLELLKRQDPTFRARENEETGQTLISGMGELHLEVIKHRLLRDFHLNVRVHQPRVSYRETIAKTVEVEGKCHRQIAGQQLSAQIKIRVEPLSGDLMAVRVAQAPGLDLPADFSQAVLEVLRGLGEGGGSLGFPLMKVKITVLSGNVHDTNSTVVAFRFAARDGFDKALFEAGTVLLEPIMRVEITMPEEHFGDFVGDLQQRHAVIQETQQSGRNRVIDARVPLANLFGYSNTMRSLSQGRATSSIEPWSYQPAPPGIKERYF